jgi:hypothetical protein
MDDTVGKLGIIIQQGSNYEQENDFLACVGFSCGGAKVCDSITGKRIGVCTKSAIWYTIELSNV